MRVETVTRDSLPDMGALRFSPGQVAAFERDGFVTPIDVLDGDGVRLLARQLLPAQAFDGPMEGLLESLEPAQRAEFNSSVPAVLRAGQASIHHSHTVHGSFGNRSDRPRRALVLNYLAADTRVADGSQPLLAGVPLLPEGAVVEGPDFPVVLDLGERAGSGQAG